MSGIMYAIGVGPGDPELMTLKAYRTIQDCDVIAVPKDNTKDSAAYKIVREVYEEIDQKVLLSVDMPMTKDKNTLQAAHHKAADIICKALEEEKNVGFLTLGDPTVYATCMYVVSLVSERGYSTEIINSVPSFCAVAARLGISLGLAEEEIHIIPATYGIQDALSLSGTKIFMKSGRQYDILLKELKRTGVSAMMVTNCTMPDEKIYRSISEFPDEASYFSIILVLPERD